MTFANSSQKEVFSWYTSEHKRQRKKDAKKILYVHVFAGHGVQFEGKQSLLVNEYDGRH